MEFIYFFTFLIFTILSIILVFLNIFYVLFKKIGYKVPKIKYGINWVFFFNIIVFLISVLFFLLKANLLKVDFNNYRNLIILFNLSTFFIFLSGILYLKCYFESFNKIIELEMPSYYRANRGKIRIGKVVIKNKEKFDFYISKEDLEKHMFICGASGTGKSNFLQNFLINFKKHYQIPFFLVEFKGEYQFLQKKIQDTLIFWPGKNFSINIFNPEGSDPEIHAERIFDILKSGRFFEENSEFSPQMEKALVDILVKICKNRSYQNWEGFEHYSDIYLKEKAKTIPMLEQTLVSIKNRIRRYSKGPLKKLFDNTSGIDLNILFNSNVILDLSSIIRLGGEKEDALFFLNMILKYLWDKNIIQGSHNFSGLKHLTIIEDAQYFAPKDLPNRTKLTTYLEDIALLQRGTGEGLITLATRPDISREILANCGIIVIFKTNLEKDLICEILNLDLEKKNFLSYLFEGQCIVRINSIEEPFLIKTSLIERYPITISEMIKKNEMILSNKKHFKRTKELNSEIKLSEKNKEKKNKNFIETMKEEEGFKAFNSYINKLYKLQNNKE